MESRTEDIGELVRKSTTPEAEIKKAVKARSTLLDALYNLSFLENVDPDLYDCLKSHLRPRRLWNFVNLFIIRISRNVKTKKK